MPPAVLVEVALQGIEELLPLVGRIEKPDERGHTLRVEGGAVDGQ